MNKISNYALFCIQNLKAVWLQSEKPFNDVSLTSEKIDSTDKFYNLFKINRATIFLHRDNMSYFYKRQIGHYKNLIDDLENVAAYCEELGGHFDLLGEILICSLADKITWPDRHYLLSGLARSLGPLGSELIYKEAYRSLDNNFVTDCDNKNSNAHRIMALGQHSSNPVGHALRQIPYIWQYVDFGEKQILHPLSWDYVSTLYEHKKGYEAFKNRYMIDAWERMERWERTRLSDKDYLSFGCDLLSKIITLIELWLKNWSEKTVDPNIIILLSECVIPVNRTIENMLVDILVNKNLADPDRRIVLDSIFRNHGILACKLIFLFALCSKNDEEIKKMLAHHHLSYVYMYV